MQPFSEQLFAARKAKGMTQEALASAAAVTRQTISSWERGRTIPDIDSVRRLSDILGVDLSQTAVADSAAPADETATEVEAQAAPAAVETGKPASRLKKWQIIAGAAALACIILLLCLLLPRKPAPASTRDVFNVETYTQETPNEADKAYFVFDNRTWEENSENGSFQMYEVVMHEQNGVAFSVTRIEVKLEGGNGTVRPGMVDAEGLRATSIETEIPAYGTFRFTGGFPLGEFVRAGVAVFGNDANGVPINFYSLIEF